MSDTIRFAVVGCGTIAAKHIDSLNKASGAKLTALFSSNEQKAAEWGERYQVKAYTDYEKLLQDDAIDAVIILTPSGLHAKYGVKAAKAGKHVVVEKPIDTTVEKAEQLVTACNEANVKLSCIFQHRFDPGIVKLKQAVDGNRLGKLNLGVSRTTLYRPQEYYNSAKWRGTWELDGGGSLMNQSIHYIDLLLYIMGPVKEVHAYSRTGAHDDIEVEDIAVATVKFKSGAIGMIEGTTAAYPGFSATLDVFGENGSVRVDNDHIVGWHIKDEETDPGTITPNPTALDGDTQRALSVQSFALQYEDFVNSIKENRSPLIDGPEAIKALQLIHAIYQSSKTGKPIKVDTIA